MWRKEAVFQRQGCNRGALPANSQPSHRWCEYWGEFSIKNMDMENMEQTGKTRGKKGQSGAKSQTWSWANISNWLLMLTTTVCAPINILINLEKCYYLTEGSSFSQQANHRELVPGGTLQAKSLIPHPLCANISCWTIELFVTSQLPSCTSWIIGSVAIKTGWSRWRCSRSTPFPADLASSTGQSSLMIYIWLDYLTGNFSAVATF